MLKIKRNDLVQVIKGKDRGKKGKVLNIFPVEKRALVEGINLAKKHMRKKSQTDQGGIVSIEAPVSISNLMVVCKNCDRPVRIGFKSGPEKEKARFCKECKEVI